MVEHPYLVIAGHYAKQIRSGELSPGMKLPTYEEIENKFGKSNIVVRRAIKHLERQGLVYIVHRQGAFVAKRPNLVRVSPERQLESAERTFGSESSVDVKVSREVEEVEIPSQLVPLFGLSEGSRLKRTVTRASESGRPISISDTYQPVDVHGIGGAATLEETLRDAVPSSEHAEWLRTAPGALVKAVHQKFSTEGGRLIMISDISYPLDRYEAYVFRMELKED